jgi:hypothetical protein
MTMLLILQPFRHALFLMLCSVDANVCVSTAFCCCYSQKYFLLSQDAGLALESPSLNQAGSVLLFKDLREITYKRRRLSVDIKYRNIENTQQKKELQGTFLIFKAL